MDLFNQAYNRDKYLDFLADKFNFHPGIVPIEVESKGVKIFEQLGAVTLPPHTSNDGKKLLVFEIHIKPTPN